MVARHALTGSYSVAIHLLVKFRTKLNVHLEITLWFLLIANIRSKKYYTSYFATVYIYKIDLVIQILFRNVKTAEDYIFSLVQWFLNFRSLQTTEAKIGIVTNHMQISSPPHTKNVTKFGQWHICGIYLYECNPAFPALKRPS